MGAVELIIAVVKVAWLIDVTVIHQSSSLRNPLLKSLETAELQAPYHYCFVTLCKNVTYNTRENLSGSAQG